MWCYKLFLPEFEWDSITPVASGSGDSRLLKCTIVIIQVQCNPWCFPRHNSKGISAQWDLSMQVIVEKDDDTWNSLWKDEMVTVPRHPLPCARDHFLQGKDICAQLRAIVGLLLPASLFWNSSFLAMGYSPSLSCKLRWFLEPHYFWPRDPCMRGSHLQESSRAEQGGGGSCSHLIFICFCDSVLSPWPQGSALCE